MSYKQAPKNTKPKQCPLCQGRECRSDLHGKCDGCDTPMRLYSQAVIDKHQLCWACVKALTDAGYHSWPRSGPNDGELLVREWASKRKEAA